MPPQAWLPCRCVAPHPRYPALPSRSPPSAPTPGEPDTKPLASHRLSVRVRALISLTSTRATNSRMSPREPGKEARMPNPLAEACYELALANRVLAHEGVLDGFGHVSMRHPTDPGRYLLARSRSPDLNEAGDIPELTVRSKPIVPPTGFLSGERVIHGCIYQARPDVHAVCHHHSRAVMPFCISGVPLQPVDHLGATMGAVIPFWDQRDEFGDTDLIVAKPEEGQSLARTLGANWVVLMRRHGATVAGISMEEMVFRSVFSCRNAEMQREAQALGGISKLTQVEIQKAGAFNLEPRPIARAWEYWSARLRKAQAA